MALLFVVCLLLKSGPYKSKYISTINKLWLLHYNRVYESTLSLGSLVLSMLETVSVRKYFWKWQMQYIHIFKLMLHKSCAKRDIFAATRKYEKM